MFNKANRKGVIILLLLLLLTATMTWGHGHGRVDVHSGQTALAPAQSQGKSEVIGTVKTRWCLNILNAQHLSENATGRNIKIGIVDSGIDIRHPALTHIAKAGFNFVDPQSEPMDDNGHGTAIAGIISAKHHNGIGMAGIAPEAEVYAVKVLDSGGHGSLENLINGIEWCVKHHMQIINLSSGVKKSDPRLKEAVDNASKAGIVLVCASGNTKGFPSMYPAAYDDVISVSAIDKKKCIAGFSAEGKIDFVAPGVNVYSTSLGISYKTLSGSSLAAAYVSGVIALLLQRVGDPPNAPLKIKKCLELSAVDLGDPGY